MATLERVRFNQTGSPTEDQSIPAGTAFQLSLDGESSLAERAAGTAFAVIVGVKNVTQNTYLTPAPVPPAPASGVIANMATAAWPLANPAQSFSYTVPAAFAASGDFLEGFGALVVGAAGTERETGIGNALAVIEFP
ncbi:MAG: hypothetical protein A2W35_10690 [Chloroflexi bacterium RBG_16_57_11]|nr:MAG: hypothetical protein A2W35_10690 [Chloroflexi bacterium RBG_16_57_11]